MERGRARDFCCQILETSDKVRLFRVRQRKCVTAREGIHRSLEHLSISVNSPPCLPC
jgi:hypothetical protein